MAQQPLQVGQATRRRFFKYLVNGVAGVTGATLSVPLVGLFILPALKRPKVIWKEAGPVEAFAEGEIKLVRLKPLERRQWPEDWGREAAWVYNQGGGSFVVYNIHCTHVGCPVRWNPHTIPGSDQRLQVSRFFFWTAWVASTQRPGEDYTYTNNWPADRSVGNVPTPRVYFWSIGAILALLLVLGLFIYLVHSYRLWYGPPKGVALAEKLIDMPLTPSQLKAAKYFIVVILLFLLQTSFGGLLAHYTVNPGRFWIPFVGTLIPYRWANSWHLQLAIFWIATTWVASDIYLAPIIGGKEPRKQGLLVQLLFVAILVVALGSLLGEVAGIKGLLGKAWFWIGHQGWEYLELGRLWQILLLAGLTFWLIVVYRAVAHHFRMKHKDEFTSLIWFYLFSAVLVVAFFAFGLFYGKGSHLTLADYWRWFVVHIWVESIFEFFGVAVISLLLVAMGLASARAALTVAYFTAALVFLTGIIGTAHHYFWYGGPLSGWDGERSFHPWSRFRSSAWWSGP